MNGLISGGIYLINVIFYMYMLVVFLRLLLQKQRADYYNPFSQLTIRLTAFWHKPLHRVLPNFSGIDLACVIVLLALSFVKVITLCFLFFGMFPDMTGALIWAFADVLGLALNILFYAIILQAVLSWVAPMGGNPVSEILYLMTEPLLRPARRLIPAISGIDLSPIPVMILLQLTLIVIVYPLLDYGKFLAIAP